MLPALDDLFDTKMPDTVPALQAEIARLNHKLNGLLESNKELVEALRIAKATVDAQNRTLFKIKVELEAPQ